jgi:hypothetical protein
MEVAEVPLEQLQDKVQESAERTNAVATWSKRISTPTLSKSLTPHETKSRHAVKRDG